MAFCQLSSPASRCERTMETHTQRTAPRPGILTQTSRSTTPHMAQGIERSGRTAGSDNADSMFILLLPALLPGTRTRTAFYLMTPPMYRRRLWPTFLRVSRYALRMLQWLTRLTVIYGVLWLADWSGIGCECDSERCVRPPTSHAMQYRAFERCPRLILGIGSHVPCESQRQLTTAGLVECSSSGAARCSEWSEGLAGKRRE